MTISNIPAVIAHAGDGVQLIFAVPFEFYEHTELRVRMYPDPLDRDAFTEYLFGTEYTVAGGNPGGGGDAANGSITIIITAPLDLSEVEIASNVSLGQEVDYAQFGKFPAEAHETGLDKLALQIKQIDAKFTTFAGGSGGPVDSFEGRTGAVVGIEADYDAFYSLLAHVHTWSQITGKPTVFPPDTHTHDYTTDLTSVPATFAPSAHTHAWGDITGKPASFPPAGTQVGAIQYRINGTTKGGTDLSRIDEVPGGTTADVGSFEFWSYDAVDYAQVGAVGYHVTEHHILLSSDTVPVGLDGPSITLKADNLSAGDVLVIGPNNQLVPQPQKKVAILDEATYSAADIALTTSPTDLPFNVTTTEAIEPGTALWAYRFFVEALTNLAYTVTAELDINGTPTGITFDHVMNGPGLIENSAVFVSSVADAIDITCRVSRTAVGGAAPEIDIDVMDAELSVLHYGQGQGLLENAQTDDYQLVLADTGQLVSIDNAAAKTLTIPVNATVAFPIGTEISLLRRGAGTMTVADGGVTIRSAGALLDLNAQYSRGELVKTGTDEWLFSGDRA